MTEVLMHTVQPKNSGLAMMTLMQWQERQSTSRHRDMVELQSGLSILMISTICVVLDKTLSSMH